MTHKFVAGAGQRGTLQSETQIPPQNLGMYTILQYLGAVTRHK